MSQVDILSPHYDDGALSAWHHIEKRGTRVITVFGGSPKKSTSGMWDKFTDSGNSDETVATRRLENAEALATTAAQAINLDFLDRQYQPFRSRDVEEIVDRIEDTSNADTAFLAPIGIGTHFRIHPDHIDTRKVGIELMERGRDVTFYADLPYLLPIRNLSEWPSDLPKKRIERALKMPVTIDPYELTQEEQMRKQEALSEFVTQMPMVSKLALGALGSVDAYKWEVVIRPN